MNKQCIVVLWFVLLQSSVLWYFPPVSHLHFCTLLVCLSPSISIVDVTCISWCWLLIGCCLVMWCCCVGLAECLREYSNEKLLWILSTWIVLCFPLPAPLHSTQIFLPSFSAIIEWLFMFVLDDNLFWDNNIILYTGRIPWCSAVFSVDLLLCLLLQWWICTTDGRIVTYPLSSNCINVCLL